MVTLSVAVMAHPAREAWVPDLVAALDHPDPAVVWDEGWNDRHETGLRALRAYDPGATHHLVVQDDGLVCRDLCAALTRAVVTAGERPLGLMVGRHRPDHQRISLLEEIARLTGAPWFAMEGPWWGVGLVVPTCHIGELTAWYQRQETPNYDRRISRWYARQGVDCWYTVPSLVDHRGADENPSLVPGRTGRTRVARRFLGTDRSALDLDWSKTAVEPDAVDDGRPPTVTFEHANGRQKTVRVGTAAYQRMSRERSWSPIDVGAALHG